MSIESMTVALHHSRARGTAKLVLIGIANHDGDGGAWPSLATLAKYAGVDPRNVRKALRELEELGEIRTHLQEGGTVKMPAYERPNRYDFLLRCPDDCDRTTRHRQVEPPDESVPRGRADASGGPRTDASPKPSFEPSSEPSSGPSDVWATKPPREQARRRPSKPRTLTRDEMNADYVILKAICQQVGEADPVSVWWTLRKDHNAIEPSKFMARLVDYGEWTGFKDRHGINEYNRDGSAA